MPFKTRRKRVYSRRPVGRTSRVQRRQVPRQRTKAKRMGRTSKAIIRQPTGTADSLYIKLRYSQAYTFSITSGVAVTQVMRGNSLFDPDFSGTGGQPYFFDQWATLYQNYTVLGSAIKVTAFSVTPTVVYDVIVCPSTSSSSYSSNIEASEQPYTTSRQSQINQPHLLVNKYMSTNKINGLKKSQTTNDPAFSAATGANPSSQWYWHIYANDVVSSSTITLAVKIVVTYYCRFFNRARPSIS